MTTSRPPRSLVDRARLARARGLIAEGSGDFGPHRVSTALDRYCNEANNRWGSLAARGAAMTEQVTHQSYRRRLPANVGALVDAVDGAWAHHIREVRNLVPIAHNVVDFKLYSAFIVGELLVFFDDLGRALATNDGRNPDEFAGSMRCGDFTVLIDGLDTLLAITEPQP